MMDGGDIVIVSSMKYSMKTKFLLLASKEDKWGRPLIHAKFVCMEENLQYNACHSPYVNEWLGDI